jgi:hypothetical protein
MGGHNRAKHFDTPSVPSTFDAKFWALAEPFSNGKTMAKALTGERKI